MKRKPLLYVALAAIGGAIAGVVMTTFVTDDIDPSASAADGERKVLYWHDPMVPGPKFDKPGKSPFMDMELVPVYADAAPAADDGAITVRPEIINTLGVRTAVATRKAEPRRVTTPGYVFRDASGLTLLVDVLERDASWVRAGLAAEIRVPDSAGRQWRGTVEHVAPDIDIGARSFKARIRINEPGAALKANVYAEATIIGPRPAAGRLLIPREALIRTGTRNAVVLALGDGRFKPVPVVSGPEVGDMIEIRDGLKEGDRVVTSGQFLIDSEANVRASFTRMEAEGVSAPGAAPQQSDQ